MKAGMTCADHPAYSPDMELKTMKNVELRWSLTHSRGSVMRHLCVLACLLVGAAALQAQEQRKTAVAVMTLRGSGVSESDAKFLTERLTIELQRAGVFEVMERDKVDEILKEQGFQQTGACDETACLVEAGRLLPVEKMIGGSVGRVGNVYAAQIRLIDLRSGKVEKTATRDYKGELEHLLTAGMRESAEELSGKRAVQAQVSAPGAAAGSQDQAMMRTLLEAQYEDKSKSKGWAVFWSVLIPYAGAGSLYAKNYGASVILFLGSAVSASAWIAALNDSSNSSKSAWGLAYLGTRVLDVVIATRSVGKYNQRLREKYGLTLNAVPYKDKLYATATFDF
jgi:TolB-like protein